MTTEAIAAEAPSISHHQEAAFYRAIKRGATREDAALQAGIPISDVAKALALGEQGIAPFDAFLANAQTCEAQCRAHLTSVIVQAASGDEALDLRPNWKSAAFILERRFPELFGPATEEKTAARVAETTERLIRIFGDVLSRFVPENQREDAIRELQNAIARGSATT